MQLDFLETVFGFLFILCGLLVGIVRGLWVKLLLCIGFAFIAWDIQRPEFFLVFLVTLLISSTISDCIHGGRRKEKKYFISI
jgi:hypothetical protein